MDDYVGEEVEVVGYYNPTKGWFFESNHQGCIEVMTVAQHQRIVGGLKVEVERLQELEQAVEENAKLREALRVIRDYAENTGDQWVYDAAEEALAATQEKAE
jgi:hypothetical protein